MLRRFRLSRSLIVTATALRFCSSASSSSPMLDRCRELDEKCTAWSLTEKDMEEILDNLNGISSGKLQLPPVSNQFDVVPYPAAIQQPPPQTSGEQTAEQNKPRVPSIHYCMSTYLRCIFSYPSWKTISTNKLMRQQQKEQGMEMPPEGHEDKIEYIPFRRPQTPERDLLATPFSLISLPMSTGEEYNRVFAMWTSEANMNEFRDAQSESFKKDTEVVSLSGYEHYQLMHMLTHSGQQNAPGMENLSFNGVLLNPSAERFIIVGSDPESASVSQNISFDCYLEQSLVMMKWMFEENRDLKLGSVNQEKFALNCVYAALQNLAYYVLQDKDGAVYLFTSMHHLLRCQRFVAQTKDYQEKGPWKIGVISAENIDWTAGLEKGGSPTINPVAPNDEAALAGKFPGLGIQFSSETMSRMNEIVEDMKKNHVHVPSEHHHEPVAGDDGDGDAEQKK